MNRIIVIEDDPSILRGLAANLRLESYDVLTAATGEEGYRLALENQPDLVILDLMLPGMNGYDICRRLRSHGVATPILMLTAQDQETHRVQGFDAGADDYVTKPFSVRELMGRVRAILRRSEGRSDLANQKELDEARHIQQRLMPSEIPQVPGLRIAATWQPARIVAGDYYDIFSLPGGGVAVCIADVCGKGMPAAMRVSSLQAAVKAYASEGARPGDLCDRVNRVMCENLGGEGFITFFYAAIAPGGRQLTYCNAGHNQPIFLRAGTGHRLQEELQTRTSASAFGSPARLSTGGGVLGVFKNWRYDEEEIHLGSGDRLLMFTDGITESRNPAGEEFGEQRLVDLAAGLRPVDAAALTGEVLRAASQFSNGNFEDDLTVVAVTVE